MNDLQENLGVDKSTMAEFFDDLEGTLGMLTGLVDYESFGLTLKDVLKPALVIGDGGMGKTEGIISIVAKVNAMLEKEGKSENKLGFKKILLGQTEVGSLSGIPVVKPSTGEVVRIQMPDLPNEERDGKYGVLFLDELTTADEAQMQPALGLTDGSRSLGEYTLPPYWYVVAAGNGPNCTNFIRLDDVMITRFVAYDISFNYKTDWRGYAHRTGINPDIIAFLNFSPDTALRVESDETTTVAKSYPCPRTWEALDRHLKKREAMGRPVAVHEMGHVASRIIGQKAAREFEAFISFKEKVAYSWEKILEGTERDPEVMQKEEFHILLQSCIKNVAQLLKETEVGDGTGNYPASTYQTVANMLTWFLKMNELENKVNTIIELRDDLPAFSQLMFDDDFLTMCPKFDEFLDENAALLTVDVINSL